MSQVPTSQPPLRKATRKPAKSIYQGNKGLIILLIGFILVLIYVEVIELLKNKSFNWTFLGTIIETISLSALWFKSKVLRSILGEHKRPKRSTIQQQIIWVFSAILLFPLSFYILLKSTVVGAPIIEPLSILVIAPTLGGLVLASARLANPIKDKKTELISVAQKFIFVTVMFVIFIPSMFLVNLTKIDPNTPNFSIGNGVGILGGFYFWIAVPAFYLGVTIFSIALIDLVFAMVGIVTKR